MPYFDIELVDVVEEVFDGIVAANIVEQYESHVPGGHKSRDIPFVELVNDLEVPGVV